MNMKQIRIFMVSGIMNSNFDPSYLEADVNEWLKENPRIEIEEWVLNTSITTFSPDSGKHHQAVITICLLVAYRLLAE